MSEHITHIGIYEDSYRIMEYSGNKFTKAFHKAIEEHYDTGLFCSGTRGNHLYAIPILEKCRDQYKNGTTGKKVLEQIAGAIGWLTHRAVDRQMKPLFGEIEKWEHSVLVDNECQMYHDANTYRHVYQGGKLSTLSPMEQIGPSTLSEKMEGNTASKNFDMEITERLFTHYIMLNMLRQCNFTENIDDVERFTEDMISQSQDLYEDLRMYIRAYQNPDPFKVQGYLHNFNVYNENDELIKFVRYIQQHGKKHPDISLDEALENASKQSHYAQALKKSHDFILAASDFFDNKISKEKTYDAVHIFSENHRK